MNLARQGRAVKSYGTGEVSQLEISIPARKKAGRCPDLTAADYTRVQDMLDRSEAAQRRRNVYMFGACVAGQDWRTIVKGTPGSAFISSFHRVQPSQLRTERGKGKVLRGEK